MVHVGVKIPSHIAVSDNTYLVIESILSTCIHAVVYL